MRRRTHTSSSYGERSNERRSPRQGDARGYRSNERSSNFSNERSSNFSAGSGDRQESSFRGRNDERGQRDGERSRPYSRPDRQGSSFRSRDGERGQRDGERSGFYGRSNDRQGGSFRRDGERGQRDGERSSSYSRSDRQGSSFRSRDGERGQHDGERSGFFTKLNDFRDNYGARRQKKILGRGVGSGLGKTSGRGGKGQTARSGVALNGFEGGQMPLYTRLPKRGFRSANRIEYTLISIDALNDLIRSEKINADSDITMDIMLELGLIEEKGENVKLLGPKEPDTVLDKAFRSIEVHKVSQNARAVLEEKNVKIVEIDLGRNKVAEVEL
ncbi:50S ribosomal protein L15 [Candidatus Fokinia crypta]|uniref:Large ribosomal subunit protein uL15 n=1 Tax=Candidatus Fokinia crypta TaxID=1920990 RepID=A0ABZ0UQ88_9RICK|nr:50S ribosomal protein L15 [Candidatus Fokinia cryptica]WPX98052.1 50S ribosomal protein L15 [Candidatus Fokinia cryptica]